MLYLIKNWLHNYIKCLDDLHIIFILNDKLLSEKIENIRQFEAAYCIIFIATIFVSAQ